MAQAFAVKLDEMTQVLQRGDLAEAQQRLAELTRRRPADPAVLCRQGELAQRSMRLARAVEWFAQAVEAAPADPALRCRLGAAQRDAGLTVAAAASFRTAATLAPQSVEALAGLSAALEELGDHERAGRLRKGLDLVLPVVHRAVGAAANTVALTIDDGPTPEATPGLLELLRARNVRASFFVIGSRAERHPGLIQAMVADGHDVFNHGYSHQPLDRIGGDPIADLDAVEKVLGKYRPAPSPYWIRLPYGSGWARPDLQRRIHAWRSDAALAQWSRMFYDWHIPDRCFGRPGLTRVCQDAAAKGLAQPPPAGSILLLHDLPIDWRFPLARDVPVLLLSEVLDQLRSAGCAPVPLSAFAARA